MKTIETRIVLKGKGKSKEEAFSKAISSLQSEINKTIRETFMRIEPLEVNLLDGRESVYTERFMFLFLKREISTFHIKIEVKARLTLVDLEELEFKKEIK